MDTRATNKSGETALDTAKKMGNSSISAVLLEKGVQSARTIRPPHKSAFMIFFVFDSVALFISLAVVVVRTSVVVVERKAKKKMMAIINKLMWLACVLISVSFLALSFIVVGDEERWLAIGVTIIATAILAPHRSAGQDHGQGLQLLMQQRPGIILGTRGCMQFD